MLDAAEAASGRLDAEHGEFRFVLEDGRVLAGESLVGARVMMRNGNEDIQVLIAAVETMNSAPGEPLVLYRLLVEDIAGQGLYDACRPDARGRRLGLPLMKDKVLTLTCTSGAEGKCILMGYRPWEERGDVPMRDLHAACIHLVRADYSGDDRPTTRDGTMIDIYDRFGIQKPDDLDPMPFEAAWGKDGAVCVAHPRIAHSVTLDELAKNHPRLRDRLGSEACTEEVMRSHPEAILFNRSALP
ncbi:ADYC domain-containing protein [Microvirga terrestris]|uniref:ADYC domain-containing protein n=1 Tax=Microvirga terrestris TaxID=2791024 RepID=A0ABS0HQB3_9HYPH|nr:ADYC domain-containing protein [Microvirga terrestris]MBF9195594.1 hypothetical protein [Microvirga terrestris]